MLSSGLAIWSLYPANSGQRGNYGYTVASFFNASNHSLHHSDDYLYSMTKYGIEDMIGKKYPNNMPVYEGKRSDAQILVALPYIKNICPKRVWRQYDQINARANATNKDH